ncbi:hypothetical protein C2845_PM13G01030 [Panicum miliaceum]|uniref:At1g61320/AtMIF1 LRR domain-containing protein n=1 Tax=Panicum miliaceum TaxID=4540 RepID=A0A3L6RJT1_PANMI|nr:hypothetical protein C2845_PM13G01030 [Panicum miliaceum]
MEHESVVGSPSDLRQIPDHQHCRLRDVKMTGISSTKSLVELACYIAKNAVSLERLALDTLYGLRCPGGDDPRRIRCSYKEDAVLQDAARAAAAIRVCVEGKVASTVELGVLGPCTRCHARWRMVAGADAV